MPNYTDALTATHLDSLIDRYETMVVKYLYMLDEPISAKLYMSIFAAYADCVATLDRYQAERDRR